MTIVTNNSTYKITPNGDHFLVEKVAETRPNHYGIDIGWIKECRSIEILIGHYAKFDTICTSRVKSVS